MNKARRLLCVLAVILVAAPAGPGVVLFDATSGASCDDCSGALAYSHHCENNDAADTEANGTCGCSDSETYKSWTRADATYSGTFVADGSYSLNLAGYHHRADINNTGTWIDVSAVGSVEGYWHDGVDDEDVEDCWLFFVDAGDNGLVHLWVEDDAASAELNLRYDETDTDGGAACYTKNSMGVGDYAGMYFQAGWDFTTDDEVRIRWSSDGESWSSWDVDQTGACGSIDVWTMPTTVTIGRSDRTNQCWIDAVKIYEGDPCDVFGGCS